MSQTELTTIVRALPEPPYPPPAEPFFLAAYWPRCGGHWKIFSEYTYAKPDGPMMLRRIAELHASGWRVVTICKLNVPAWDQNKPAQHDETSKT